jgi:hypothetical protein
MSFDFWLGVIAACCFLAFIKIVVDIRSDLRAYHEEQER